MNKKKFIQLHGLLKHVLEYFICIKSLIYKFFIGPANLGQIDFLFDKFIELLVVCHAIG